MGRIAGSGQLDLVNQGLSDQHLVDLTPLRDTRSPSWLSWCQPLTAATCSHQGES